MDDRGSRTGEDAQRLERVAIEYEDLRTILETLRDQTTRERLLVLGDALVHVDPGQLTTLAAETGFALASAAVPRLDPFTLGDALGFARTETLDVNGRASIELDLHAPPPSELIEAYDCLIDAGVLFWCSDPGAALRSILAMVKVGGTVIHICAVSGHYGRGYYNVHPLLFEDFYLGNACEFRLATYRPKFRPRGILRMFARLARLENEVSRSTEPGGVYLADSTLNRISFAPRYREPVESNIVPNNVLGVFVFRKLRSGPIAMPVRTSPYEAGERQDGPE
jgi:hypothetical protein